MAYKKMFKRKFTKRKRAPRPYAKRKYFSKARKMAKVTNVKKELYYFKRKRIGTQYDLTAQPTGALQWQLNDLNNYTELTSMFDQYMITGVKISFRLIYSPDSTGNVATSQYPNLYVRTDYDDNNLSSATDIVQSNRAKRFILGPNRTKSIFVRPSILTYQKTSGAAQVTAPVWKQWVDCAYPDVVHLGLKWAIDTMGQALPANTRHLQIDYTYYLALKNTR